jgi:hypothetical protein
MAVSIAQALGLIRSAVPAKWLWPAFDQGSRLLFDILALIDDGQESP